VKKIDFYNKDRLEFIKNEKSKLQQIEWNLTADSMNFKDLNSFRDTRNALNKLLEIFTTEITDFENKKSKINWF
jgi:hypothetical protein